MQLNLSSWLRSFRWGTIAFARIFTYRLAFAFAFAAVFAAFIGITVLYNGWEQTREGAANGVLL